MAAATVQVPGQRRQNEKQDKARRSKVDRLVIGHCGAGLNAVLDGQDGAKRAGVSPVRVWVPTGPARPCGLHAECARLALKRG
jgi:hypothetical protein